MKKEGWTREATELVAADARNVFEGYDTLQSEATILAIVREEAAVDEMREGDEGSLFFDVTPFYGESGGQVGDEGVIRSDGVGGHRARRGTRERRPLLAQDKGRKRNVQEGPARGADRRR